MPLVSKTIAGLFNGVSQQPAGVRLETQCEDQENCYPTLAEGLMKRPHTDWLAKLLLSASVNKPFVHAIRRDTSERYIVVITGDAVNPIDVFKLDGTKMTVKYGRMVSFGDITPDDTVKSYVTVADCRDSLRALTVSDYTFIINNQVDCALKADVTTGTVVKTVQSFDKLPTTPTAGDIYKISGDHFDDFSGYYVEYDGDVYVECTAPNIKYSFDKLTMPHALIRTGVDEFTFAALSWNFRHIGDDDSNPAPSFVDAPINEVFMFKNRLGFLSGENICLSRSGDFFNFFRKSALDILDDDPIDTSISTEEVALLRHSIAFNESLLLFSDTLQFSLNAEKNLTPKTAGADITTRYPSTPTCPPVGAGANVYFASPVKEHMSIREYFVQPDSLVNDAANVTAHVPRYLPPTMHSMESVVSLDTLLMLSDDEPNTVYVYKYYWQGNEKVQSSWGKWEFDAPVVSCTHIDSSLYLILKKNNEFWLEVMNIENVNTGNLAFRVHLDHQVTLNGTFDGDNTTWVLPYDVDPSESITLIFGDTGATINGWEQTAPNTFRVYGNFATKNVHIGINYKMRYRMTEWAIRDEKANVASLEGRLQVRNIMFSYVDTGYFRVEVTPKNRETLITALHNNIIGHATIGVPNILTGKKKFPVLAHAVGTTVDVVNDTYLPTRLQNASWEGMFHKRSGGI